MPEPISPATITGDTLERLMYDALRTGDMKGVHAALSVMTTTDPQRAERLLNSTLQDALVAIARIGQGADNG